MGFFLQNSYTEVLLLAITLITVVVTYFYNSYQYWSRKGVPFLRPRFPLGNSNVLLPKGLGLGSITKQFYDELKQQGHKFGGVYLVTEPNLVVVDPEYIKDILSRDFEYFTDRGFYYNEKDDPLTAHLFAIDGDAWRSLRVKLTPTFSSGKMKMMFGQMMELGENMTQAIEHSVGEDLDIKEILSRFTTDVIGLCAFGVECNSFKYPDAKFRTMGKKIFQYSLWRSVKNFFMANLPNLSLKLHVTDNSPELRNFFNEIVTDTIATRKEQQIKRNDFLQIMSDLKETAALTINEIVSHAFLFFLAGSETSSSTMTFALYHMAKDSELQNKLRHEIRQVLTKHSDQITYESLSEMKYLDQVIDETLRMYPSMLTLIRKCTKDYRLRRHPDVVIEKGTRVHIPALGLHMDPEHYPEPEKFDPDRFSNDNKKARNPFVHLPFGYGPRNCIGSRFGLMQTKIGIVSIVKNFNLSISTRTKPVELDPYMFVVRTTSIIYLRAEGIGG